MIEVQAIEIQSTPTNQLESTLMIPVDNLSTILILTNFVSSSSNQVWRFQFDQLKCFLFDQLKT